MEQATSHFVIRQMQRDDIKELISYFCFPWSSIQKTEEKWLNYYAEQEKNRRIVALVEKDDRPVGYGSLHLDSQYPHFKEANIPEIHDIWIDSGYRGQSFGKKLIIYLEDIARQQGHKKIGLGVGLNSDYGRAQQLYIKLGYIPDGKGVTYKNQPIHPHEKYSVDDDLILWMIKSI